MPNYKLKSDLLKENTRFQLYKKNRSIVNKYVYMESINDEEYRKALAILFDLERYDFDSYKECERLLHSGNERTLRLKKRISKMLYNIDDDGCVSVNDCLFLTLTFNNKTLESTCDSYRRIAVRRYLKDYNCPFVANIDFGKKNGREHYHALIQCSKVDYSQWRFGAINGIKVRTSSEDLTRISKYISKLTNHAIKETTKRCHLIYSRNT